MLVHGRRRVREGQREEFSNAFRAFAEVAFATPGVKAVFCFDGAGAQSKIGRCALGSLSLHMEMRA